MLIERLYGIREELSECEGLPELEAITKHWTLECEEAAKNEECRAWANEARKRLEAEQAVEEPVVTSEEASAKLAALLAQLQAIKSTAAQSRIARAPKRYQLLSTNVDWSTKPQVHAVMAVLAAHAKEGEVLDEDTIVQAMEENREVLQTKQGGKRVWDYYKGDHHEGLVAHGNIKKV